MEKIYHTERDWEDLFSRSSKSLDSVCMCVCSVFRSIKNNCLLCGASSGCDHHVRSDVESSTCGIMKVLKMFQVLEHSGFGISDY